MRQFSKLFPEPRSSGGCSFQDHQQQSQHNIELVDVVSKVRSLSLIDPKIVRGHHLVVVVAAVRLIARGTSAQVNVFLPVVRARFVLLGNSM